MGAYKGPRRRRPSPDAATAHHTTTDVILSSPCRLSFLPILFLLLLCRIPVICAFSGSSTTNPLPPPLPPPPPPLIDRVPTFRLYQYGLCQAQVSGKGEVGECRSRLHEAITAWAPSKSMPKRNNERKSGDEVQIKAAEAGSAAGVSPILEITSLEALELLLLQQQSSDDKNEREAEVLLVEFYGQACKQCITLAPLFESLPFMYRNRRLRFGRADVTHFPTLVIPPPAPTAFMDLDRSQDIEARLEGCPRCGGGGFVPCGECAGKGHIVRSVNGHSVADVCMACVGHRKVPCPQCGGKCYLC